MTATSSVSIPLDQLSIAAPCEASWDDMAGDDRTRFCAHCSMNVYNLSGMTRDEALKLVQSAEGRLCVRFYRRPDGTMLTRDCPVGLRALRRTLITGLGRIAAAVMIAFAGLLGARGILAATRANSIDDLAPVSTTRRWLDVRPVDPPVMGEAIMGDVACPTPPATMGRIATPATAPAPAR